MARVEYDDVWKKFPTRDEREPALCLRTFSGYSMLSRTDMCG